MFEGTNMISRPNVMGNRPTGDHYHVHDDLDIVRLAVSTMPVLGELRGANPLEVSTGDVVEDQIRLEAEEVTQAMVQRHLDLLARWS